jgi:2-oxoglutarate dehydrogenase complex dehydrogenase (E1) component-like enzyme
MRKLIFVSGKLYYQLTKRREETGSWDVAIVRIEQISPFPYDRVAEAVKKYPNAEVGLCFLFLFFLSSFW